MSKRDDMIKAGKRRLDRETYTYEKSGEDTGFEWVAIDKEDTDHMLSVLSGAYIDVPMILDAMHNGMMGRTPFAAYRAIKKS